METVLLFSSFFKRTTVKRTCIKVLPNLLVIHLMRFGFDWESGRSIKYDEQIRVRILSTMLPVPTPPHSLCLMKNGSTHASYLFSLLSFTF